MPVQIDCLPDNSGVRVNQTRCADPDAQQRDIRDGGQLIDQLVDLLNRCIANRDHGRLAWDIVRQRWAEANERFPGNTIVRMVDPVKLLTQPDVVADVQSFFSEHEIPQSAKTLDQILERQRVNAALREREAARLAAALAG